MRSISVSGFHHYQLVHHRSLSASALLSTHAHTSGYAYSSDIHVHHYIHTAHARACSYTCACTLTQVHILQVASVPSGYMTSIIITAATSGGVRPTMEAWGSALRQRHGLAHRSHAGALETKVSYFTDNGGYWFGRNRPSASQLAATVTKQMNEGESPKIILPERSTHTHTHTHTNPCAFMNYPLISTLCCSITIHFQQHPQVSLLDRFSWIRGLGPHSAMQRPLLHCAISQRICMEYP